jgi:hypothetical protein
MFEMSRPLTSADVADCHDSTILAAILPSMPTAHRLPEPVDLEMPAWVWRAMGLCYAIFFGGLLYAVGRDGEALFVVCISIAYTLMYFGTAKIMLDVSRPKTPAAFARGVGPLQTNSGPMDAAAVAGQVLVVPACFALFGAAVAIMSAVISI